MLGVVVFLRRYSTLRHVVWISPGWVVQGRVKWACGLACHRSSSFTLCLRWLVRLWEMSPICGDVFVGFVLFIPYGLGGTRDVKMVFVFIRLLSSNASPPSQILFSRAFFRRKSTLERRFFLGGIDDACVIDSGNVAYARTLLQCA
jgi:hypothetical protein